MCDTLCVVKTNTVKRIKWPKLRVKEYVYIGSEKGLIAEIH